MPRRTASAGSHHPACYFAAHHVASNSSVVQRTRRRATETQTSFSKLAPPSAMPRGARRSIRVPLAGLGDKFSEVKLIPESAVALLRFSSIHHLTLVPLAREREQPPQSPPPLLLPFCSCSARLATSALRSFPCSERRNSWQPPPPALPGRQSQRWMHASHQHSMPVSCARPQSWGGGGAWRAARQSLAPRPFFQAITLWPLEVQHEALRARCARARCATGTRSARQDRADVA